MTVARSSAKCRYISTVTSCSEKFIPTLDRVLRARRFLMHGNSVRNFEGNDARKNFFFFSPLARKQYFIPRCTHPTYTASTDFQHSLCSNIIYARRNIAAFQEALAYRQSGQARREESFDRDRELTGVLWVSNVCTAFLEDTERTTTCCPLAYMTVAPRSFVDRAAYDSAWSPVHKTSCRRP